MSKAMILLRKDNLNSDDQQFHREQPSQSTNHLFKKDHIIKHYKSSSLAWDRQQNVACSNRLVESSS